ncbi:exodeoxyribonuclease V subunit gamma [Buchnera aphidicola]|uniref:exodeoxyribonuclease V subunit gamma n=1 Tax=Buchnera aphidicola TaxID=9 RepID=UPI00107DACA4|nr:exodeoxyribonuclease V subunit gamma [Buchnera aphidicola]VFP79292.1 RecBCD enzyme subunit RecC [Buchnera aphidicola (Cinara curtihirsuta)]
MLKIYQSNQINFLLKKICTKIMTNKNKNIFIEEIFLIDNLNTKKWIEIYISKNKNISINIKYLIISKFFISLMRNINNKKKYQIPILFKKKSLQWILMSIIRNKKKCLFLKKHGIFYNNFEFCSYMANIFIKYIFFKPELIYIWETEKKNNSSKILYTWQKKLWKLIIKKIKDLKENNFTEIINNFLKNKEYLSKIIPKKIFILSFSPIDPFINFIIHIIKNITSIYLFQYKIYDKEKKNVNSNLVFLKKINILLKKKNDKQSLLCKKKFFFNKPHTKKILSVLQYNLFNKSLYKKNIKKKFYISDKSIFIHKCYSHLQEIQILYTHIINILNSDKKIKPHNILITTNNINPYLYYINQIFSSFLPNNSSIYNSNINILKKNILLIIQKILQIKRNRFNYSWVLSLLDEKLLRKKFFIKSDDIKIIYKYISDLNVRFGFNKDHFKKMSITDMNTYSWSYAIKRITVGFLLQGKYSIWNNISIYNISSNKNNILLGNFIDLITKLQKLRKKILNKKLLKNWLNIIPQIIKEFFYIPIKYKVFFFKLENIWKKIISTGITMNYLNKISIDILLQQFFKYNFSLYEKDKFMSGYINVMNLNKIRMIPFKMICIIGCNQENISIFNKTDILNLINSKIYQKNKNIFFETIISAQKYLLLSYTKNTMIENKNYPSNYITDIIYYIKKNFYIKKKEKYKKHTINIINKVYINNKNKLNNFYLIDTKLEKFSKKKNNIKKYKKINFTIKKNIKIKELINFWKNPIQYFFKKNLNIHILNDIKNKLSKDELFSIQPLDKHKIKNKILKYFLLKKQTKNLFKKFQLKNQLPPGNIGKILWKKEEKKMHILSDQINKITNSPKEINFNLKIKKYKLSGKIKKINKIILVRWCTNKINYKEIISLWIEHIICCILKKKNTSILLGTNNSNLKFSFLKKKKAEKYLEKYIQGYIDGLKKPLLILKSGIIWLQSIYFKKFNIIKNDKYTLNIAKKNFLQEWNGNLFREGEKNNIYIKKLISKINPIIMNKICHTCKYWLLPIFKNTTIKKYHII